MIQPTIDSIERLSSCYEEIVGVLSPYQEIEAVLKRVLSILLRETKRKLIDVEIVHDIIVSQENLLKNIQAGVFDLRKDSIRKEVSEQIGSSIVDWGSKLNAGWARGDQNSIKNIVNEQVDLSGKLLTRVIDFESFVRLLGKTEGVYLYTSALKNVVKLLVDDNNFSSGEIQDRFEGYSSRRGSNIPQALNYQEEMNLVELSGPSSTAENWRGVKFPVSVSDPRDPRGSRIRRFRVWVTLDEALSKYKNQLSTIEKQCCTTNRSCCEKLICWLGLAHMTTGLSTSPNVILQFTIPELDDGRALAVIPNQIVAGYKPRNDKYRFFVPHDDAQYNECATSINCGRTYDLAAASIDKNGQGLPEWVVFAEYIELQRVWIAFPQPSKPNGCRFKGQCDDNESYLKALTGDNNIKDLLSQLSNELEGRQIAA